MLAWHFVGDTLRDGRPVPADHVKLVEPGKPVLCEQGLHASDRLTDALKYAPGLTICRVEMGGEIVTGTDKLVATERTILWRVDGREIVPAFARWCALQVIDKWDMPGVVRQFLETGDPALAAAAMEATTHAKWSPKVVRQFLETGDRRLSPKALEAAAWVARAAAVAEAEAAWVAVAAEKAEAAGLDPDKAEEKLVEMVMEAKGDE